MALAIAIGLALLALALLILSGRMRTASGLPEGRVIYSDTGAWRRNEQPLLSREHGLAGKPDYLVQDGASLVPVEVKSGRAPAQPRPGHVLQLAAYCLLVEEAYGQRPAYGIVKYADKQFAIDYTDELESMLLDTLGAMRRDLDANDAERSHADSWRCAACGVRAECDQRLD